MRTLFVVIGVDNLDIFNYNIRFL